MPKHFFGSKADIKTLLGGRYLAVDHDQLRKRRQVLERVVEVVKVLGKRGLSYRHVDSEAANNLDIDSIDHSNFFELIILLGKYDVCLKEHLNNVIVKSKQMHESGLRGRGSFITLLSKTTINSVIDAIRTLFQENISTEIQKAGMFSLQLDTTQDIAGQDQFSVSLRYITDVVHERLVAVVRCSASSGQSFVKLLTEVLEHLKLEISLCIGNSTDGALTMQG